MNRSHQSVVTKQQNCLQLGFLFACNPPLYSCIPLVSHGDLRAVKWSSRLHPENGKWCNFGFLEQQPGSTGTAEH